MEKMIKCCFYGSLRRHMYNYNRLVSTHGINQVTYIKTVKIKGWDLYNLGDYPGIIEAGPKNTIVVDLFDIFQKVYDAVYKMESGANFYEDDVMIDGVSYRIFPYAGLVNQEDRVIDGDWFSFINKLNRERNDHAY